MSRSKFLKIITILIGIIIPFSFSTCKEDNGDGPPPFTTPVLPPGDSDPQTKIIYIGSHSLTVEKPYSSKFTGTKDSVSGSYYAKLGSIVIRDVSVVVFIITNDGYGGQITLNPGTYTTSGISEVWAKFVNTWFLLKSEFGIGGGPGSPQNAQAPNITSQPEGSTVTINNPFNLSVTANSPDDGTLTYQWYSNTSASNVGGTVISGATSAAYNPPTGTVGTFYYFVQVTNTISNNGDGGTKTATARSNAVEVQVISSSVITIDLTGMNEWDIIEQTTQVTANNNHVFTVSGNFSIYRWYLDGSLVGTSSSFTFNKPDGVYQLMVAVINNNGESRSGRCWVTTYTGHPPLVINKWTTGNMLTEDSEDWYSFPVTLGMTYYIWWNDKYQGDATKTGDIVVGAKYKDQIIWIFGGTNTVFDDGWVTPRSFTANQTGTVEIRVIPCFRSNTSAGTYGLTYSTNTSRPVQ